MSKEIRGYDIEKLGESPYQRLAYAIVLQAARDYRAALKKLYYKPNAIDAKAEKESSIRFFKKDIKNFCDIDGDYIMYKIQREFLEKMNEERKKK